MGASKRASKGASNHDATALSQESSPSRELSHKRALPQESSLSRELSHRRAFSQESSLTRELSHRGFDRQVGSQFCVFEYAKSHPNLPKKKCAEIFLEKNLDFFDVFCTVSFRKLLSYWADPAPVRSFLMTQ